MKSFKFQRLFVLLFLVPTVSSLIISSVYAGKKKFKTYSFGTSLLPSIVKVQPNKLHLTFRQYKYLRTPQFKIEGTLPLKAPTVVREVFKPDPYPEVKEYNFGDMAAIPEANQHVNQHVTFDDTQNNPVYVKPTEQISQMPLRMPSQSPQNDWKPIITRSPETPNYYRNHRIKRFANDFINPFDPNSRVPQINGNFGQNYVNRQNSPNFSFMGPNTQSYASPPNFQNYFNSFAVNHNNNGNPAPIANSYPNVYSAHNNPPQHQFNSYNSGTDMTSSSSSFAPPKYERYFNPSNQQNNKWIPIISSPSVPSITQTTSSGHSNSFIDENQKKVNIGEHYNPSASYVDEKMVEKPTYDPDESEPDEGSVSFSISGPHGGEEVPAGYEARIKEMHQVLKEHPQHLPPGLDMSQIMKYYTQHTFTDPLKDHGYKQVFGPLGFLKSKLKSWKNIIH